MAEVLLALDLFNFIEGIVTCSFCSNIYRNPLVLSTCFHTFCCDCLQKCIVKSSDSTPTDNVLCPQCSQITVLPFGKGTDSLMKNFMVEKLLEINRFVQTVDRAKIGRQVILDFIRRIRDVTECPICRELFSEPRLLPCVHTFCASCLKGSLTTDFWKPTTCPMCRQLFLVPEMGFALLPRNDVLDRVLQKMSQPEIQQLVTVVLDPDRVPENERQVTGVCELGGVIYVLFSTLKVLHLFQTEPPYAMILAIPLPPGIISSDLASCKQEKCLFITDVAGMGSVWRVQIEKRRIDSFLVQSISKVADGGRVGETSDESSITSSEQSLTANVCPVIAACSVEENSTAGSAAVTVDITGDAIAAKTGSACARPVEVREAQNRDTLADFLAKFVDATRNRITWTPETDSSDSQTVVAGELEQVNRYTATDHSVESSSGSGVSVQECPEALRRLIEVMVERKAKVGNDTENAKPTVVVEHHVQLWLRNVKSIGASVGPARQLVLVTDSGDLFVYNTANRDLIGRYVLPEEVQKPRHAVIHCRSGNFIVSHSAPDGSVHRLSELKLDPNTGRLDVIRVYGSTPGQQLGHLHWPRHLAADVRGYTFVADCSNNRVLLLDDKLNMIQVMLSHHHNLELPWRLTQVPECGLLVVGSVTGSVQIYSIEKKRRRK